MIKQYTIGRGHTDFKYIITGHFKGENHQIQKSG